MPTSPSHSLPNPVFDEPVFQEGQTLPDPKGFHLPHPSDAATYKQLGKLLKKQTTPVPPSRVAPDALYGLDQAFGAKGAEVVQAIRAAGKIAFHAVGDTGAANSKGYGDEIKTADRMVADFAALPPAARPAFFFHLGDLVYSFGEGKYYYDEFYDPYRNYPRPIVAIPGNHDSFVVPGTSAGQTPLAVFQRNFCAASPAVTPEAFSLHRTAVTAPGVYFAFDAPFVRIIGLFSNALEDPGVISTEQGRWPNVTDVQLDFLRAQLTRIRIEAYAGAVLLALHHPPFTYVVPGVSGRSAAHGGSPAMLREIDTICAEVGVYPHAVISGHAHNYQCYTRKIAFGGKALEVPFIVCGGGGHHINALVDPVHSRPSFGADVSYLETQPAVTSNGLVLEKYDDQHFGYLLVTVDAATLRIAFHNTAGSSHQQARFDLVTLDLARRVRIAN